MTQVKITGMSCAHCAAAVKQALEELGIQNVQVSLEEGLARFLETAVSIDDIRAAVDDAGFSAE